MIHKNIKILLLLLSIWIFEKLDAQHLKPDSLENLLNSHQKDDIIKVKLLNEFAYVLCKNDTAKARSNAEKAFELATRLNFPGGEVEALWIISKTYNTDKKEPAFDYLEKALTIAKQAGYQSGIAKCLIEKGIRLRSFSNYTGAMECFQSAQAIYKAQDDNPGISDCLYNIATVYILESKYDEATVICRKLLEDFEKTGDKSQKANCLRNLGTIHYRQGYYAQGLDYYQKALIISELINDETGIYSCHVSIGNIYIAQADYPKALEEHLKVLKYAETRKDKKLISTCCLNIGEIYQDQGNPKTLEYYNKALQLSEEISNRSIQSNCLQNIGDYYFAHGNYQKSLENYQKSLTIAREIGSERNICRNEYKIGSIYFKLGSNNDALEYTLSSLGIAKKLNILNEKMNIYLQLSEIYATLDNFKQAYDNYKNYKELNDSIFNEKNIKKIAELEYAHKFEKEKQMMESEHKKKEAVNQVKRRQQNIVLVSFITGFILMSFLAFFLYRSYWFKTRTNLILSMQKEEIGKLNEEYRVINEELIQSNEQLQAAKKMVESSEEKLSLLIKNSNDILVLVDEKGEQFFISDVARKLTGFELTELMGPIENVIHPEDIGIVQKHWETVMKNKNITDVIQYRHKHKEKAYVWFEAAAQNFLGHPAINAIVANIRDITERKRIEQDLDENRKKISAIIEQISDALIVFDADGKIVIWNSGAEKMSKLSSKDTLDKKFTDIWYQLSPSHHRNKTEFDETIRGMVNFETPDLFHRFIDNEILLSGNTIRNIQGIFFPIDLGTHYLFGSIFRDITEKIYIEKQLEEFNLTKQKLLTIELDRTKEELETNQKSITAATLKLIQNSERDAQTIERLMEISKDANDLGKQKINTLVTDYKRLSYNSNWDEFEILFEKVHHSFYEKLNQQFPNLTANERKICAFLKLNMSSKDIANITFQSEEALKKARLRLRQKLDISRETNLMAYLQNI